ncbi:sensor domain-containing protein [Catenulispora rubra]|uniref:sensor domain-containing protein n=1 Tax=Catenulispora rubra TaxID=280293 RepID=UPI0018921E7E|nr:sensor domain-containing protein [Catenulispora rubra]
MRTRIKGGSIAVVTAAVLMTAACSSSGQIGGSAAGTSAPGAAGTSGGSKASASGGSVPNTSIAPPTSAATSAATSGGASGTTLSADQIGKLLLTDKDDPGYTYDASQDDPTTTSTQDVVKTGGAACQTFVDAQDGLTTKYGTTAEVNRQLRKASAGHAIQDSVLALPSADKAQALIADLTTGLQGCKNLSMTLSGSSGTMAPAPIPQLMKQGQAGYINYLTISGKTVLMAALLVHVGSAVSVVVLVGPVTNDKTALEQMGATLGHLSDIQVGRLKAAQGLR